MKKIYVLLSRTGTSTSKLVYALTHKRFTHTAFALEPRTDRFFSYARRIIWNPLIAGFFVENIHTFVYAKYPESQCALLEIEISDKAHEKLKSEIEFFKKHYRRCTYNFLGAAFNLFGIKLHRKYHFTCSQFVATMLYRSGEVELPADPSTMLPSDFLKIKNAKIVYEGKIENLTFPGNNEISENVS